VSRLNRIQNGWGVVVATATVALSYQLRPALPITGPAVPIVLYSVCVLAGILMPRLVVGALARSSRGRRWLLGKTWLEGHWVIGVTKPDGEYITTGLIEMTYTVPDLDCVVRGYFPRGMREARLATSTSDLVNVRQSDLRYVSSFTTTLNEAYLTGVAVGHYSCTSGSVPDEYDGKVIFFDGGPGVRQHGIKLSEAEVLRTKAAFGINWREQLIESREAQLKGRLRNGASREAGFRVERTRSPT
jgi:hypothetical protein